MSELSKYNLLEHGVKEGDDIAAFNLFKELYDHDYGSIVEDGNLVEIHTGGWSENEELIEELRDTFWWTRYFSGMKRGGHYYFDTNSQSDRKWRMKKVDESVQSPLTKTEDEPITDDVLRELGFNETALESTLIISERLNLFRYNNERDDWGLDDDNESVDLPYPPQTKRQLVQLISVLKGEYQ